MKSTRICQFSPYRQISPKKPGFHIPAGLQILFQLLIAKIVMCLLAFNAFGMVFVLILTRKEMTMRMSRIVFALSACVLASIFLVSLGCGG